MLMVQLKIKSVWWHWWKRHSWLDRIYWKLLTIHLTTEAPFKRQSQTYSNVLQ